MFFKKVIIENVGPISNLEFEFPKDGQKPKPVVVVGENGSGKSILLSYLVNSLIVGKQTFFDDTEVEKGKVFKYITPKYISAGKHYSHSVIDFDSGDKVEEWQLSSSRSELENILEEIPTGARWNDIPRNENSFFESTFNANANADGTKSIFKEQCYLYFPPNRFEEPAWLNFANLKSKANYSNLKMVSGYSNRDLICTSPLKSNINWLLDVMLDLQVLDIQIQKTLLQIPGWHTSRRMFDVFCGFSGQSANIYNAIQRVLKIVLRAGNSKIQFGFENRHDRRISIAKDGKRWIPNLFQLSTGEVQLINLFLSIIRDYDLSFGQLNDLDDIKGIVIVDEIDSHLHTFHQKEVLPDLIKSFPNVQFIVTTHAPLFLIGMEEKFGEQGFDVINMPAGERVFPSDFSEFTAAYDAFRETAKYRDEMARRFSEYTKTAVLVEGDYDCRYLKKAAELLGRQALLKNIELASVDGFRNLNNIWKGFAHIGTEAFPNKIVLLYDCDTKEDEGEGNNLYKRVIPLVEKNPIKTGVENLFPLATIEKVEKENSRYVDNHGERSNRIRGKDEKIPASRSINKDEKGNMCAWLCEHGEKQDFIGFQTAFDIIEEIVNG